MKAGGRSLTSLTFTDVPNVPSQFVLQTPTEAASMKTMSATAQLPTEVYVIARQLTFGILLGTV